MDPKCALYINKYIWLVHKPSTKCHLGWANERSSTLKVKPKKQNWIILNLLTYLPMIYLPN